MCEWLLNGEWCDVKLLCGGRAFNAHRAVLASVSSFLRQLLLSCPMDESPTYIVLPDFDIDAMSSVLYYIYNGEVVVKKEKIEMFLDIINTMQIFIDRQYFPNITEKINVKIKEDSKMYPAKKDIFALGFSENYVYLKKDNEIQTALPQYSNISDYSDKLVRNQNQSSETISSLGNLKSSCKDRQRNSFLRDLFIETYPQNGNVNGLEAGVLAIPNECYQTSALLTNANVEHLNNKIHSATCKKSSEYITYSPSAFYLPSNQRKAENKWKLSYSEANSRKDKCKNDFNDLQSKQESMNPWMDYSFVSTSSLRTIEESIVARKIPSLELSASSTLQSLTNRNESSNFDKDKEASLSSKVTILNHVLDSPWTPRVPGVFKPFRKKLRYTVQCQETNQKLSEQISSNDNNNNVEMLRKSIDVVALPGPEDKLTPKTNLQATETEFNCTICNQVFTTDASYTAHMRRHSTTARYTCGECGKTFSQLRNFKYHMSIHRGTREFAATCSVCGKYFNDRGYLSSHMKIHRNRKEYKCTICPKSFNQRVAYNMHMRIHTGVKPHVCSECGKAFSRKMLLKQHQRTHSGERPYACPHCDKRFADRSNMTLHLRLHTGVKPFSCTLCPKSFTKKHHLKSHLNFHTGSKPYSCPHCKLAFTQSSNMRTHMKKCHAPEPIGDSVPM